MKLFSFISRIFKAYTGFDKFVTFMAFMSFILMLIKMVIFPYGLFGFGTSNVYTEGFVSKNGFQSINPLFVDYNDADREVSALVFSGLMKYDPEKRAIVDDMAFLSVNESKTEYTLILREGMKWHDGVAVNADDVYFTFHDVILSPSFQNQILKANFSGVKIEKIDNMTVKFILEKPNIFFISNLTIGILPKHILGGTDPYDIFQDKFNKMPIGTGPYMVKGPFELFQDGSMQISLVRNPYYYSGVSEIDVIRLISYLSMEDLLENLTAVNSVVKVTGNYFKDFENNERFDLIPYELPQYTAVFMNMESNLLKESNVRLALQKSVDKEDLVSLYNDKKRVDTPFMELNQEDWEYKSNSNEAQGALKDAGYSYADDDVEKSGVRFDEDGNALELRLIARLYDPGTQQFDDMQTLVAFLQESWERVGFDIQVEFLFAGEFEEKIMMRDYDLLLVGQSLGYNLDTYSYWHSTQADPKGQNFSNYKSFAVDSLIESIRSIFEKEKRQEKLSELAENLKENFPAVFLFRPTYYYAIDGKISGVSMDGVVFPSDRFSNVYSWMFMR